METHTSKSAFAGLRISRNGSPPNGQPGGHCYATKLDHPEASRSQGSRSVQVKSRSIRDRIVQFFEHGRIFGDCTAYYSSSTAYKVPEAQFEEQTRLFSKMKRNFQVAQRAVALGRHGT
ncbi:hypothetical protein DOTSEDRAFT_72415 [Dothistroma septosporum NZE10]|uniref:Uncharacterized protein n=1 Tax=Dothistroma septosporum (strain NZE10 / CBS 128990) TaxID=675120 RepID=M2WLS8_DOTSN|nr:hypothetical protein DOTSEDRAFT_72415 [Dothistroma septosporum NZE10]